MFRGKMQLWCLAVVGVCVMPRTSAIQNKVQRVYVQTQQTSDQDKSASGYVYRSDGNGPATYINLGGHPAPIQKFSGLLAPVGGQYVNHAQYVPKQEPVYVQPVVYVEPQPVKYGIQDVLPTVDTGVAKYIEGGHSDGLAAPFVEGSEVEDSHYKKGGGENYNQANHESHGEKGAKGYQSHHGYDKAAQGKHDNAGHKGYYAAHGGHKAALADKTGYYSGRQAGAHGSKGGSFHQSDGHKKGSKTTGFHNVYHKDEYKKDHTFYDEADHRGHHEKHGDGHVHHAAHAGGYKKGGSGKGAYHADHYGKSGHHDKGHHLDSAKGYKGEHGADKYYADAEKYGKKSGHSDGSEHGYSHGDGSGGKYYH